MKPIDSQVKDALHGRHVSPVFKFRYDLLDKNEVKKAELTNVVSGEVSMSSLAEIKRTARFRIEDVGNIDWLSDRIQPFVLLKTGEKRVTEGTTWGDISAKKWSDL